MNRIFLATLGWLAVLLVAHAEVTDTEIAAIGIFLNKDFSCASSKAMQKPVTESFLVCEGKDYDEVDAKDVKNAQELYSAHLLPGRYREIWVLCDVVGYGMLVRQVFVGPQGSVYWADEFQSLAHLRMREGMNQFGADRLADFAEGDIRVIFSKVRKGSLPAGLKVTQADRDRHLATMDVLPRVARTRQ